MNENTSPDERRERYATAISKWHRDPEQPLYTQGADAVIAVADAEQAEARERYTAGLRRADEMNNQLMEEVQRYADSTERPVLWSVYNEMHKRALTAEARAAAMQRAMESTAADALAHRGCHMKLMAQCQRAERAEAEADRLRRLAAEPAAAGPDQTDETFIPPAARNLPAGTLEAAEIGANRLDAWARTPSGRNFLAHALVQLARAGWLRAEPGDGWEPMVDADAPAVGGAQQQTEARP